MRATSAVQRRSNSTQRRSSKPVGVAHRQFQDLGRRSHVVGDGVDRRRRYHLVEGPDADQGGAAHPVGEVHRVEVRQAPEERRPVGGVPREVVVDLAGRAGRGQAEPPLGPAQRGDGGGDVGGPLRHRLGDQREGAAEAAAVERDAPAARLEFDRDLRRPPRSRRPHPAGSTSPGPRVPSAPSRRLPSDSPGATGRSPGRRSRRGRRPRRRCAVH